jgi:hypothetical protein
MRSYFQRLASEFGSWWNRFWFTAVSPAPLGLIRLVFGLLALWWYLSFYADLTFFFGPDGIIRAATLDRWRGVNPAVSIFDWPKTNASLWVTYWLGLIVLLVFTAGLFSRISSIAALVVVVSLIHRGPMFATPMEDILALAMFYLCLGPSGAAFSLDRLRKQPRFGAPAADDTARRPSIGANIALRLMQIHVTLIYLGMAIGQLRDDSWWTGRALWGFIGKPDSSFFDFTFLADHLLLLNLWTHAIVVFELAFAFLSWNRLARPILMVASVVIWASIAVVSGQVGFALVMLAATLAFVPPEWLSRSRLPE